MTDTVLERYAALVAAGELTRDPAQEHAARALDGINAALAGYRLGRKTSALGWLFARKAPEAPKGLYIWGEVGRGKTMLMDLFFERAPVRRKRRVHFNAFMADVHARVHAWRQQLAAGDVKGSDPIAPVAEALAEEAWLLCFDEFQVTDIADAMILGRLFERLFEKGVVVIATSNVAPSNLYRHGLNRALFLPFIAIVEEHMRVLRLDAAEDFRLIKLEGVPVWHVPADEKAAEALDDVFMRLAVGAPPAPVTLNVLGRTVTAPRAAMGVARFTFAELCDQPLAAADYLAIAERFHTLIIDAIPQLTEEKRNPTKRFILLIDTLYESHVKLIASAAAEPESLLADGNHHAFEFQRTLSRLTEMRSAAWLAAPHGRGEEPRDAGTGGLAET
ncbi:cell division protein ZapE [Agaricicola taiwanensis]|uniref:Cell division protein ZapE n=1 Tax=Agaricicola taiwanensis TaxID=591372 RepID=A0A8J2YB83_9RHOB|nr:cell division protein ZapE [Agaricicola taiwanensis]GGE27143.1 cell division protein ZapE [Agaricicola taiwanensis]